VKIKPASHLWPAIVAELAASTNHSRSDAPLLSKPYRKQDLGRAVRAALD